MSRSSVVDMIKFNGKTYSATLTCVIVFLFWITTGFSAPESEGDVTVRTNDSVQRAQERVSVIDATTKRAAAELERSQKSGDDARLRCVRDKWTAMKGLLKLSSQALLNLQQAQTEGDRGGVEHEKTKIGIAAEKVTELEAQVLACGGGAAEVSGDGGILIEKLFEDDLPKSDPTAEFRLRDVELSRPTAATQIF